MKNRYVVENGIITERDGAYTASSFVETDEHLQLKNGLGVFRYKVVNGAPVLRSDGEILEECRAGMVEKARGVAQEKILASFPLYKQNNLLTDKLYSVNQIRSTATSSSTYLSSDEVEGAVALAINPSSLSELKALYDDPTDVDLSSVIGLFPSARQRTIAFNLYQIASSILGALLIRAGREWCNGKESEIAAASSVSALRSIDLDDFPEI